MEILDAVMGKILPLDVLNIFVGGVGSINVAFTDEVGEVFLVRFSPVLCFYFWRGWQLGGGVGLQLCVMWLWQVVVVVAVLCQGI